MRLLHPTPKASSSPPCSPRPGLGRLAPTLSLPGSGRSVLSLDRRSAPSGGMHTVSIVILHVSIIVISSDVPSLMTCRPNEPTNTGGTEHCVLANWVCIVFAGLCRSPSLQHVAPKSWNDGTCSITNRFGYIVEYACAAGLEFGPTACQSWSCCCSHMSLTRP